MYFNSRFSKNMSGKHFKLGQRVLVPGKNVKGVVAYVGCPTFANGNWVGIILDKPKGKNNGTIRGHAYFQVQLTRHYSVYYII